jgi:hypothetical protein
VEGVQCFLYGRPAGCIFGVGYEFEGSSGIICSLQKCLFVRFEDFSESLIKRYTVATHIAEISELSPSLALENVCSELNSSDLK